MRDLGNPGESRIHKLAQVVRSGIAMSATKEQKKLAENVAGLVIRSKFFYHMSKEDRDSFLSVLPFTRTVWERIRSFVAAFKNKFFLYGGLKEKESSEKNQKKLLGLAEESLFQAIQEAERPEQVKDIFAGHFRDQTANILGRERFCLAFQDELTREESEYTAWWRRLHPSAPALSAEEPGHPEEAAAASAAVSIAPSEESDESSLDGYVSADEAEDSDGYVTADEPDSDGYVTANEEFADEAAASSEVREEAPVAIQESPAALSDELSDEKRSEAIILLMRFRDFVQDIRKEDFSFTFFGTLVKVLPLERVLSRTIESIDYRIEAVSLIGTTTDLSELLEETIEMIEEGGVEANVRRNLNPERADAFSSLLEEARQLLRSLNVPPN